MRHTHRLRALIAMAATAVVILTARPNASTVPSQQTAGPGTPHRIISLIPAVTEMLFAIGAGNEVVAVSSYDHFPAEVESRPRVGALVDPDFERILSLRPDLVIVYGTQDDLIARLGRANLPIFRYEHAGLADITATIRAIGARVGHADDSRRVADQIEGGLEAVRGRVAGKPRPSTAVIFGREAGSLRGIFASAGVGFLHDMLETAGGVDCFGDIKRQSVQASVETMLARAPEVLLELRPSEGWSAERLAQERDVWKLLSSIPAVRTNRVYILAGDSLLVPGPRVLDAVQRIAAVLHPGS